MKREQAKDAEYEPEFLVIAAGIVFVLMVALLGGRGHRWRFPALLFVQGPRAVVFLRGTFLVTLLAALLVKPQREALTEFLQHALLLALGCAMRCILTSASGRHVDEIQDGGWLLQSGITDQRNRRLRQGMLGCHVTASRSFVLLVAGPLSTLAGIFKRECHVYSSISLSL